MQLIRHLLSRWIPILPIGNSTNPAGSPKGLYLFRRFLHHGSRVQRSIHHEMENQLLVVNQLSSSIQLLHFLELLQAVLYYFYCPWMGSPSSRGFLSLDGKKYPLVSLGDQRNKTNSFRTGLSTINHLMKTLSSSPWENIEHFHTISYMTFSQWFKVRTIICKLYLQNWR